MTTDHYKRITEFMRRAGQETPPTPTEPASDVLRLRAELIFEEAMEAIAALGCTLMVPCNDYGELPLYKGDGYFIEVTHAPNMVEIADGCADLSVVSIGTLVACGIPDAPILQVVDESNMAKFGEGGHMLPSGKWQKPPDWTPPPIADILNCLVGESKY